MHRLLLAATALAVATPAFAQAAEPTNWTGFYVGGRAGYSFQPGDGDETINFDNNLDGLSTSELRMIYRDNANRFYRLGL